MAEHVLDQDNQASGFPAPNSVYAVWGDTNLGWGIIGTSAQAVGVFGEGMPGVLGSGEIGVAGNTSPGSTGGIAVFGSTENGTGIVGHSENGIGISGDSSGDTGVLGLGVNAGVVAFNRNNDHAAYLASNCCAAWFTGDVHVSGTLSAGAKQFQIDHPLDPEGKYLIHASIESADRKNVYDGVTILDYSGDAEIVLPDWLEAINTDFRYQLTPIGTPCPGLYVAKELSGNRFKVSGGIPGTKISWQVTGIRKDPWALAHPMEVEKKKSAHEHGHYMHPELHGADHAKSLGLRLHPNLRATPSSPNTAVTEVMAQLRRHPTP
jgi:hypothetical protein